MCQYIFNDERYCVSTIKGRVLQNIFPNGHYIWWEKGQNYSFGPKNELLLHFRTVLTIIPPYIMTNRTFERKKCFAIPSL